MDNIKKAWKNYLDWRQKNYEASGMGEEAIPGTGITKDMMMGFAGTVGPVKFNKGLLSMMKPARLKALIKEHGADNVRDMIRKGIRIGRAESKDVLSGSTMETVGDVTRMKIPGRGKDLSWLNPFKGIYAQGKFIKRPDIQSKEPFSQIPYELQKWVAKNTPQYINKFGEFTPKGILFINKRLGTQFSVNKARHLSKKSSGGYGGTEFNIPVKGQGNVTIKGPWSSRPSIVRAKTDMKDFKGWGEMGLVERYKALKKFAPDMKNYLKYVFENTGKSPLD